MGLILPAIQAKGSTEEMLWGVVCVLAQSLNAHQKKGISADLSIQAGTAVTEVALCPSPGLWPCNSLVLCRAKAPGVGQDGWSAGCSLDLILFRNVVEKLSHENMAFIARPFPSMPPSKCSITQIAQTPLHTQSLAGNSF